SPCGSTATLIATKTVAAGTSSLNVGDSGATITFSLTGSGNNGIWGLYAVPVRPTVSCAGSAPDCAVGRLPAPTTDPSTSVTTPARPDIIIGIDNSAPTVTITDPDQTAAAPQFLTKTVGIPLSFTQADQDTQPNALSGVAKVECRNSSPSATPYVSCASGG